MSDIVYRTVLGDQLDSLPEPVRALHSPGASSVWRGVAKVQRGANPLVWLICRAMRFPQSAEACPLTLTISSRDGDEHWHRDFNGNVMPSVQRAGQGRDAGFLVEHFGAARVVLELRVDGDRLAVIPRRCALFGIPLPSALAPRGESYESADGDTFHFDVQIKAPFIGSIITYRGTLREDSQ